MLDGMSGANGWVLPIEWKAGFDSVLGSAASRLSFDDLTAFAGVRELAWIGVLLAIAWFCPNSQQIMAGLGRLKDRGLALKPNYGWGALGAITASAMVLAVINGSRGFSEFIYFNF
jgi:hypothetical protein